MSYPINLEIEGKVCVVLGGGHVALRKVEGLLEAGGRVILISPKLCEGLEKLVFERKIEWRKQSYIEGCLPKGLIFIAATDNLEVNKRAALEASTQNMLINIVNKSELRINQFCLPAVIRKRKLMLTISTEGLMPGLSKSIRRHLESQFNDKFAKWLERLSEIRDEVKIYIKDARTREEFWRNVMSDENFNLALNGEIDKAEVNIINALNSYRRKS